MDRNSLVGLVLIGGILIGWLVLNGPSKEELRKQRQKQDSLAKVEALDRRKDEIAALAKDTTVAVIKAADTLAAKTINIDSVNNVILQNKYRDFSIAARGGEKQFVLENEKVKITFLNKGGKVLSAELKEYTRPDKKTLVTLFDGDSCSQALVFLAYNNTLQVHTDSLFFEGGEAKKAGKEQTIVFKLPTAVKGSYIEYVYTLKDEEYMLNYQVRMVGMQNIILAPKK